MANRYSVDRVQLGPVDLISGAAAPNTLVLAPVPPAGSMYRRNDGSVWQNLDGTNTGWILVSGGSTISGEFPLSNMIPLVAGTGAASLTARQYQIDTGAVPAGDCRIVTTTATGFSRGKARDIINWGKAIHARMQITALAGTAAGRSRVLIGETTTNAVDPVAAAIGIRIDGLAIKGLAFGGALQTVDLLTVLVAAQATQVDIQSDGDGNVRWFVNGVIKGTTALGPAADGAAGASRVSASVANNADAANQTLEVHSLWTDCAA